MSSYCYIDTDPAPAQAISMATFTGRRVQVLPISVTAGHTAEASEYGSRYDAVDLTGAGLEALGGVPYRVGQTWGVFLDLSYLDSDGTMTAWDLSSSSLVMRIYRLSAMVDVDTRTQDTVITGSIYELEVTAPATDGKVKLVYHESETPEPGVHAFELLDTVSSVTEILAKGFIEILPALPAAT